MTLNYLYFGAPTTQNMFFSFLFMSFPMKNQGSRPGHGVMSGFQAWATTKGWVTSPRSAGLANASRRRRSTRRSRPRLDAKARNSSERNGEPRGVCGTFRGVPSRMRQHEARCLHAKTTGILGEDWRMMGVFCWFSGWTMGLPCCDSSLRSP